MSFNSRALTALLGVAVGLLAAQPVAAQRVYYNISGASVTNTLSSVSTNGGAPTVIYTASGLVGRCTAMAVDGLSSRVFFLDGPSNTLWSCSLSGTNLTLIKAGLTNYPTDLALDVLNQRIYFSTSSTVTNQNTLQRIDYTGSNNVTLYAAGAGGPSRCTALAVDLINSKIFVADAGAQKLWSLNLAGGGATTLATTTNAYPVSLAVDVTNQLVYFTASSTIPGSNTIQRVSYAGSGLTSLFTAGSTVQRCTAIDLDVGHGQIYLSDAGTNNAPTLWKLPLAGGTATSLTTLPGTAKRVRWYSGPTQRPPPYLSSITRTPGATTNVVLSATNGFIGGTYYILTSTNVTTPVSQWTPIFTNVLLASGNFSMTATNSANTNIPARFYILQVQ